MADAQPELNSITPPQAPRASRVRTRGGGQRHERQTDANQQVISRGNRGGRHRPRGARGYSRSDSTTISNTVEPVNPNTGPPDPSDRGGISGDSMSRDVIIQEDEDKLK